MSGVYRQVKSYRYQRFKSFNQHFSNLIPKTYFFTGSFACIKTSFETQITYTLKKEFKLPRTGRTKDYTRISYIYISSQFKYTTHIYESMVSSISFNFNHILYIQQTSNWKRSILPISYTLKIIKNVHYMKNVQPLKPEKSGSKLTVGVFISLIELFF